MEVGWAADETTTNRLEQPVERLVEGVERQMIVGEELIICRLRFAPHVITPARDHPHEQMTLVEKGRVLFTIGNKERIAKPGDWKKWLASSRRSTDGH
jgi:quercetin dioxygenase-like cupin family protein